jgi:hypothetical protein
MENLHSQYKIHPIVSQQVLDELVKLSDKRELEKKKVYAQANYYLPIFGKIYQEITGLSYWPNYGKDNAALKDVIRFLRKNEIRVEDFFAWVCKHKSKMVAASGLTVLNNFKNEYTEYRKKNEF